MVSIAVVECSSSAGVAVIECRMYHLWAYHPKLVSHQCHQTFLIGEYRRHLVIVLAELSKMNSEEIEFL